MKPNRYMREYWFYRKLLAGLHNGSPKGRKGDYYRASYRAALKASAALRGIPIDVLRGNRSQIDG